MGDGSGLRSFDGLMSLRYSLNNIFMTGLRSVLCQMVNACCETSVRVRHLAVRNSSSLESKPISTLHDIIIYLSCMVILFGLELTKKDLRKEDRSLRCH